MADLRPTTYPHIRLDEKGIPYLVGTRTKVVEIVMDRLAYHWDADEIQRQHTHLGLAQIHAALAYYYDHQEEVDRDIEERMEHARRIQAELGEPPPLLLHKLREATRSL
ncbi:MAG: DUF433 domain-containing protein [Planctomycetes bacterium]|nr:DUF433 domain-containing protein [Planctomycetota bacterium]